MNQVDFDKLTRDDKEKLKFVLNSSWEVAILWVWEKWDSALLWAWEWTYVDSTTYSINDLVEYNWSNYICTQAWTWNLPTDTAYWDLAVAKWDDSTVPWPQWEQWIQWEKGLNWQGEFDWWTTISNIEYGSTSWFWDWWSWYWDIWQSFDSLTIWEIKTITVKQSQDEASPITIECNIFATDWSWLPTWSSLWNTTAEFSHSTYNTDVIFIFSTAINISDNTIYAFTLSTTDATEISSKNSSSYTDWNLIDWSVWWAPYTNITTFDLYFIISNISTDWYSLDDWVSYNWSSYVSLTDSNTSIPTVTADWWVVANKWV